ncbi:hypothetical protein G7068_11995 [Leucobacter viscericola]|uniref:Uncharacterized protein n=1 Tax=Leucobacter viscericola TaxID=2714935 RepID=A0A6G7XHJ1_9MICO|nr:hypothetical protein [Leucobacter viscericola]QIK63831.1 hypothetical protein G7068_11995 [Leucobacter viscericola]
MASIQEAGIDRWFIGGGAEHTPESARRLVHTATRGNEGVGGVSDLKVMPLAIPGQGVRVITGSALIRSRFIGGETQTYQANIFREVEVPIAQNTTNQDRYDLVILRVEDPHAAGSAYPKPALELLADEQYIYVRVISGVSATTTRIQQVVGHENDTAITLGRIKIPAMKGTIDNITGTITDLRKVAQPMSERVVRAINLTEAGTGYKQITNTGAYPTGGQTWPAEAESAGILDIDIPEWATYMAYTITWSQLFVGPKDGAGNVFGGMWLQVGATIDPDVWRGQLSNWDIAEKAGGHTMTMRVADTAYIKPELRGKTKRFFPRVNLQGGSAVNAPSVNWASSFDLDVTFKQTAA